MRGAGSRGGGVVAGLVAAAAFATSGPVAKPLFEAGWTPGGAMLFRLGIGAVLLAGPALHQLRGRYALLRAEWRVVLTFGVVAVGGCSTLYYLAVDRLPVAVALLLEYAAPLLLIGYAWVRTRRTPPCPRVPLPPRRRAETGGNLFAPGGNRVGASSTPDSPERISA